MCKKNGDYADHLLYCEVAYAMLNVFFKRLGVVLGYAATSC
jgi:hypothetical protein